MDEHEIIGIVKDKDGMISHFCVKGYGVQPIAIIEKLIIQGTCSFFTYDGKRMRNVYAKTSPDGTRYLTTDAHDSDTIGLNFLPISDKPLLKQLIESVR